MLPAPPSHADQGAITSAPWEMRRCGAVGRWPYAAQRVISNLVTRTARLPATTSGSESPPPRHRHDGTTARYRPLSHTLRRGSRSRPPSAAQRMPRRRLLKCCTWRGKIHCGVGDWCHRAPHATHTPVLRTAFKLMSATYRLLTAQRHATVCLAAQPYATCRWCSQSCTPEQLHAPRPQAPRFYGLALRNEN